MPSYYTGQVVNGYEIVDCITSGAFATSYKAKRGGKMFFLKEYTDPTEGSPDFRDFVKQQDDVNARLCSRKLGCLERLLETFTSSYHYHQVKELLDCVDLANYLQSDFDLDNRLFICRLWLGILRELSSGGIVHQDLKPEQILMVKRPGIRLDHFMIFADFDWAVLDGKMVRQVGTPGYATPEHMTGTTPTTASDLYQSGVVLYQILVGSLPFYHAGEFYDPAGATDRMQRHDFEPPAVAQPVVPAWASDIVTAMLAWDPAARPSVDAVITAWDRKTPLPAAKAPPTPPPKLPEWIRLRHDSGANMAFASPESKVTRQRFHDPFRKVLTVSGNPVAAYFPSDDVTPLFTVRKGTDAWEVAGSSHRNYGLLNGTRLDESAWLPIRHGDTLEIYARNESAVVACFSFEVPA